MAYVEATHFYKTMYKYPLDNKLVRCSTIPVVRNALLSLRRGASQGFQQYLQFINLAFLRHKYQRLHTLNVIKFPQEATNINGIHIKK